MGMIPGKNCKSSGTGATASCRNSTGRRLWAHKTQPWHSQVPIPGQCQGAATSPELHQTLTIEAGQFITSVRIKRGDFNFSVIHLSTLKVRSCPKNIKKMFLCRTACFVWAVSLILLPLKLMDKSQLTLIGAGPGPTAGRWEWLGSILRPAYSWGWSHSEGQSTN